MAGRSVSGKSVQDGKLVSDDLSVAHEDYSSAEAASLAAPNAWRVQRRMSAVIGIAALLAGYAVMVIFAFTLF